MEDPSAPPLLRLTSGVHVVVRRSQVGHTHGITFTSPVDGRVMFVLPWGDLSYIGTTDVDYAGPPGEVRVSPEEVRYLLRSANALFPNAHLGEEDVISSWAGVRPLLAGEPGAAASAVSREHRVLCGPAGMITVAGGKLTTYRQMAAEAVNAALRSLPFGGLAPPSAAATDTEPLPGGEASIWEPFIQAGVDLGFPAATVEHLVRLYGTETAAVCNLALEDQTLRAPIHPEHPAVGAEVVHCVRRELAVRVADVLDRRLHLTVETADGGRKAAAQVADLMARELGWDAERREREITSVLEPRGGPRDP
jgi:glycerol-3-phosphate dehydrogenase